VQWRGGKNYKIIDQEDLEWSFKPVLDWFYLRRHILTGEENLISFLRHNGIIDKELISIRNNDDHIEIINNQDNASVKIGDITLSEDRNSVTITIYNYSYTLVSRNNMGKYYSSTIKLQSVLAIYRNLRENYEYRLR
jgi:hypothetical protein